jgi:hypothetical protein
MQRMGASLESRSIARPDYCEVILGEAGSLGEAGLRYSGVTMKCCWVTG